MNTRPTSVGLALRRILSGLSAIGKLSRNGVVGTTVGPGGVVSWAGGRPLADRHDGGAAPFGFLRVRVLACFFPVLLASTETIHPPPIRISVSGSFLHSAFCLPISALSLPSNLEPLTSNLLKPLSHNSQST